MTRRLRVGFKTAPIRVTWGELEAVWREAGELDCFDSAWLYDHLYPNDGDGGCFEAFVSLTALSRFVPRARVGHLVLANPYRNPSLVAKMVATIDHVVGGRFVLGLGAGWHEVEAHALGMDLAPISARLSALRSAVLVIRALMSPEAAEWPGPAGPPSREAGGVSLEAGAYQLRHARNDPPPVQGSQLPIWLGVQGEAVGLRIAAELADGWNFSGVGSLADFRRKRDTLRRFVEAAGRDASSVEVSAQIKVDPDDHRDSLERCIAFAREGCEHLVLYVDPRVGPAGLRRLADRVVAPLDGLRD